MTTLSAPAAPNQGVTGVPPSNKWGFSPRTATLLEMIGFEPTGEAQAAVLRCRKRFKLVVGGAQAGKSIESIADWCVHLLEDRAKRPGEPLLYWLVAADYDRTRAEFGYIQLFLSRLGIKFEASKRVDPGFIEVDVGDWHFKVETKSGKDPRTLAMFAPDGIIACEASQLDLETYYKLHERLAAKGGWLHLSGTYETNIGWYPTVAKEWQHGTEDEQSFIIPAITNTYFYPGGLADPKVLHLKANTSDKFFLEKIMGVAAPPAGMVFDEFSASDHVRPCQYDPDLHVQVSVDPGFNHPAAVEVWQEARNGQIRVFDEIYERGKVTEDIIDICMARPWWKNPNKTLVIDPNYVNQHQGNRSVGEVWTARTGLIPVGDKVKVGARNDRFHFFLKPNPLINAPGMVIDPKCKGILAELGVYANPFDNQAHVYSYKLDSEGNRVPGDEPDPKWDDGISALGYGIVEHFGLVKTDDNEHFVMTTYSGRPNRPSRRLLLQSGAPRW